MISILICSIKPDFLAKVKQCIANTIELEYEIIAIDNRSLNRGLCSVYNELASKAKFPYLLFLHEDVQINTQGWGKMLIKIFNDDDAVGLIGVAGSKYKSAYYSGWFSGVKELDCANYIHQYTSAIENVFLSPDGEAQVQEVVCIDGVFICARKKVWEVTRFDEVHLTGFHFYDIDFSLRVAKNFKAVVTYDILLAHITTGGDYGNKWIEIAMSYHQRIKNELPFYKDYVEPNSVDPQIIITALDFLKNYSISFANKLKWVASQNLYKSNQYYYPILKFFLYKPMALKRIHNLFKSK